MRSPVVLTLCCSVGLAWSAGCDSGSRAPAPQAESPKPALGEAQSVPNDLPTDKPTLPAEPASMLKVTAEPCGESLDGEKITQYVLSNSHKMTVKILDWGGIITAVEVPDRNGRPGNVTLGFSNLDGYFENAPYFGGIVGRFANRIARGKFTLDEKAYTLHVRENGHHLHGGKVGFIKKVWKAETVTGKDNVGVIMTYTSPDGEEGYPGTLSVTVNYVLNDDNELTIDYTATTDQPTVLNLTNHAYWNLAGSSSPSILDHELTLFCDEFLDVDQDSIPTGKLTPVAGTCMDFTTPHAIGERIAETTNGNGGYDHCFVIRGGGKGELLPAAKVVDPDSGRVMEISTTEPGVQLYTGNYLNGTPETGNAPKQGAFCLETQHFPDSPNRSEFPTTVLRPGDVYRQTTIHKFSVAK